MNQFKYSSNQMNTELKYTAVVIFLFVIPSTKLQ